MPRYDGTCKTCGTAVAGHEEYCPECRRIRINALQRERMRHQREAERLCSPFKPCADCGRLLVPAGTQKQLCDECRIAHKKARDNHRLRGKKNCVRVSYGTVNEARRAAGLAPYRGRPEKGRRVEDIVQAAEEGLSYGKYVQQHRL